MSGEQFWGGGVGTIVEVGLVELEDGSEVVAVELDVIESVDVVVVVEVVIGADADEDDEGPPVTMQEQAEDTRAGSLWHCET